MPDPLPTPACPLTCLRLTQSCCMFQMRIGRQQVAATAVMTQKPPSPRRDQDVHVVTSTRKGRTPAEDGFLRFMDEAPLEDGELFDGPPPDDPGADDDA